MVTPARSVRDPQGSSGSTRPSCITLSDRLWSQFVRQYWEKAPVALTGALPDPLGSSDMLFVALCRAADLFQAGRECVRFSFWIRGSEVSCSPALLPRTADGSIVDYIERVVAQSGGGDFTLLLADPHLYHVGLWNRTRVFLRGLFAKAGIPCGGVDTGIFLGRYRRTPFGVHRGQMSVLTFPVHGVKYFRTWPCGYGESHPDIQDRVDYPEHLSGSFELEGGTGDVLYWPADVWHIAEGNAECTAAMNVGFWWDRPALARVLMELSERLSAWTYDSQERRGSTLSPPSMHSKGVSGWLSPQVAASLAQVRQTVNSKDLSEALVVENLRFLSADGFKDVPPIVPSCVDSRANYLRADPACILLALGSHGTLYVAANGHSTMVRNTPRCRRMLHALNSGVTVAPLRLRKPEADLLSWLLSVNAVYAQEKKVARA